MRRLLLALSLVLSAGCGGSSTDPNTPPPPPPSPPGPPASVTVQAGDAQQAEPGAPVPVQPAVLVKDASGRAVSGATVQFAVVAGGGTVTGASATSNAQGIATVGSWVLGPIDAQTLEATVGSVTPVRFQATVAPALTNQTIGPGGGTLAITTDGHPYKGLVLTVPTGAFPGSGSWRIGLSGTRPTLPLPAGFTEAGPPLVIETDRGRAAELMTLRIPVETAPGRVPLVVMTDPSRNVRELIPLVGYDQASVTVAATHLNPSLLLGPTGPTPVGMSFQRGFLTGVIQVLSVDMKDLLGGTLGVLGPLSKGWPLGDVGSFLYPRGHGPAVSIMSLLGALGNLPFGSLVKAAFPGGPPADSAAFAALMVIAKRDANEAFKDANAISDLVGKLLGTPTQAERDTLAAVNLRAGLATSNLPQLLALTEKAPSGAEPRVVFATMAGTQTSTMWFTQPYAPTAQTPLNLSATGFSSTLVHEVADATPFAPASVVPLGGSFVYPVEKFLDVSATMIDALTLADLARKTAIKKLTDEAELPTVTVELQATEGAPWKEVDSTVVVRDTTAQLRVLCQNCPNATPKFGNIFQQAIEVVTKSLGTLQLGALPFSGPDFHSLLDPIAGSLSHLAGMALGSLNPLLRGLIGEVQRPIAPLNLSFLFPILAIEPAEQRGAVGAPVTFRAKVVDPPKAGYDMEWTWGDGKVEVVANADSASHEFETEGDFVVKATLKFRTSSGPAAVGVARAKVHVGPPQFVWAFQSATIESSVLPPGGIGPEKSDTVIFNLVSAKAADLQANPGNSSFFVYGIPTTGPSCHSLAGLQQFPQGQVADTVDGNHVFALLGICGDEDITGTLTMGKLGSGSIVGTANGVATDELITLPGGTVNATMKDKELTGTFVWFVRYSNGQGSYTASFRALQVRP